MKVSQWISLDEGITNPKRSTFGVTLALRWGDVLHPLGSDGNWFHAPYFTKVLRFYSYVPLPFISGNLWGWRFYFGAKVYGADAPEYKFWMNPDDVYAGSQAIQFSGRLYIAD